MGAIAGLLGLNGGVNGTGAQAPALSQTDLTNATQLSSAYQGNQNALNNQQNLLQALQGQNGIGNQSQVYSQLQGIANGTGPNPAQAMLNQATGQNVANQAALMAGQRGAGANPALIARQAAQQGANIQQQAVGQGATMQAQQALNAIGMAGNLAGQQVQNQVGATNANTVAQQAEQQALLNAQNSSNQQVTGFNQSRLTGGMAQQGNPLTVVGQGAQGIAGGLGALAMLAQGGSVPQGPRSRFVQALAHGGRVKALVSPGERLVSPSEVKQVAKGGLAENSKKVPGKPKYPGNDYRNDVVPADLKEGTIVIPNSVMQSKDPVRGAAQFVQAQMAKKRRK